MKKMPYDDFLSSMTMFFINNEVDEKYKQLRKEKIQHLVEKMKNINSRPGLKEYIIDTTDSLDNLLVVLGISKELFKRVISMFRLQSGMTFSTEWSLAQTRKYILSDENMLDKVCDLFLGNIENQEINQNIPKSKLDNFMINNNVMQRLNNYDFLDFLVKKDFDTQYNADIAAINAQKVESILKEICSSNVFSLTRAVNIDPVGNKTRDIQVNYTVTKHGEGSIVFYIKYSFNVTTSKVQSDFKRSVKDVRDFIKHSDIGAKQIVILDGAGWIGRQSDLKDIWDYSDYCLNLKNIDLIKQIIK